MTRQKNAVTTLAKWAAVSLSFDAGRSDDNRRSNQHSTARRFASVVFFALFAASTLWSHNALAQMSGTLTATNVTPPTSTYPPPAHQPLAGGGGALWTGGARTFAADPNGSGGDGVQVYRGVAARLRAPAPVCTNGTATITLSVRVLNNGPANGAGYSGRLVLFGSGNVQLATHSTTDHPVGTYRRLTITRTVPPADVVAGNITAALWLETFHVGSKSWIADQFQASYSYSGCNTDLAITKSDSSTTYTPGTNVTYSIVARNNGPFAVQNARVTDSLPAGITTASWTCATTTGGGVCGAASGSGAINTTANLPVNAAVTYTLTLFVPSTFSGNLVNTARVAAPTGLTDANTANNSASDTDGQFPAPAPNVANLSCRSDASLLNTAYDGSGGRLTSGLDTHWQVALTTTNIAGAPPGGLSYNAASVLTNPPANYMVSPYNNANWISHAANGIHPTNVSYDVFYRYQLNLGPGTDPATLRPRLDFYSDNSVIQIWVNGAAQNIRSNYGAGDPYFYAGFQAGNPAAGMLVGPWNSGFNEVVVHVKSGPGAQAFLAQVVLPQSICQPATINLNKVTGLMVGGPFGFGLTNTAQAAGSVTTVAVDTPTPVDGDTASPGNEPFAITAFGTDVEITESTLPTGWLLSDVECTSDGTPIGSRLDNAYTIPGDLIDASGENFVCTFTNTPTASLSVDKVANPTALRTGEAVTYTITVNNDGPAAGDGAVISDPPVIGVDCDAATLTCNANGGAVCPASLDVATFQDTGLTIPTFPAGGSLQFGMVCTVTATGQ